MLGSVFIDFRACYIKVSWFQHLAGLYDAFSGVFIWFFGVGCLRFLEVLKVIRGYLVGFRMCPLGLGGFEGVVRYVSG